MVLAGELDQSCFGDPLGEFASELDGNHPVTGAVNDKGRCRDERQHGAHIHEVV